MEVSITFKNTLMLSRFCRICPPTPYYPLEGDDNLIFLACHRLNKCIIQAKYKQTCDIIFAINAYAEKMALYEI